MFADIITIFVTFAGLVFVSYLFLAIVQLLANMFDQDWWE